jgi:hypothetical protein
MQIAGEKNEKCTRGATKIAGPIIPILPIKIARKK